MEHHREKIQTQMCIENKYLYRYLQVRDYIMIELRPNENINKVIRILMDSYKQKGTWPISAFYEALGESREMTTLYSKNK